MDGKQDPELQEMARDCVLMRTRLLSRVITNLYDQGLRPFGLNSPQFALLVILSQIEPATRAEIGRRNQQDRSTLTRNLQIMLSAGWIEETLEHEAVRGRPIQLTSAGRSLLSQVVPVWRDAQAQARIVLGADMVKSVTAVANGLIAAS